MTSKSPMVELIIRMIMEIDYHFERNDSVYLEQQASESLLFFVNYS
jgi:hypothetical protein